MSIIVPKIKNIEGAYEALVYESWPTAGYSILPDNESYKVDFTGNPLIINKNKILANGLDFVTISFPAIDDVDFILNDEVWSAKAEEGWAKIEVAAIIPGILNISVNEYSEKVIIVEPDKNE
jgi:hypothetical protein